MEVNEIKGLGRDGIVRLAVDRLLDSSSVDASTFDLSNFDVVRVMASDRSVYVTLDMSVRFVPMNTRACYGLYINLTENMVSWATIGNPSDIEDGPGPMRFFMPTEGSRKAIRFVEEAIKRSGMSDMGPYTIFEGRDHYDIEIVSEHVEGGFKVEKRSGKVYDDYHNHLVPPPSLDDEDVEVFEEILD